MVCRKKRERLAGAAVSRSLFRRYAALFQKKSFLTESLLLAGENERSLHSGVRAYARLPKYFSYTFAAIFSYFRIMNHLIASMTMITKGK